MNPDDTKKLKQEMSEQDMVRISDAMNPAYLFSRTHVDLLVQIANGTIRTKYLARGELEKRGLNREGLWVGFEMER